MSKKGGMKGRRAVSNIGFMLTSMKAKKDSKEYAPVRILSPREVDQINRDRGLK